MKRAIVMVIASCCLAACDSGLQTKNTTTFDAKQLSLKNAASLDEVAQIFYDTSASALLLRHQIISPMVSQMGPILLEVYGDGRMQLTRPAFMKQAGSYEKQLSAADLAALLKEVIASGVMQANSEAPSVNGLYEVSDGDIVSLELNLLQANAAGFSPSYTAVEQVAPRQFARHNPANTSAAALARADEQLRQIMFSLDGWTSTGS